MNICTVEECNIKSHCKGLCSKHYSRFTRHGDVTVVIDPWESHIKKSRTRSTSIRANRVFTLCLVNECKNISTRRGLCQKHFYRNNKYGSPYFQTPIPFSYTKVVRLTNNKLSSERIAWLHIKQRCYKTTDKNYSDYGGRGIKMYEPWIKNYEAFYEYIGPKPSKSHTLDRIDNNKGYFPGNIRWATWHEQQSNKRNNNKFVGVSHVIYFNNGKKYEYWSAYLMINKKQVFNKLFKNQAEAVQARIDAELKYLGIHLTRA